MKPVWTNDQVVAQLTNWKGAWNNSGPVPFMLYGQFLQHHQYSTGFAPFNPAERLSLLRTMEFVSDVANVSFVNIASSAQAPSASNPFMGFYTINQSSAPFWGAAMRYVVDGEPPQPMGRIYGVDIVVNHHRANVQGGWEIGDSNSRKLMHELLHGLGLDHAGEYNGDSATSYQTHASYFQDSNQFTVMSYWAASETGAHHVAGGVVQFASTPLLFDVAALQKLYGANMSTRTGNTVYGFNDTSGRAAFDLQRDPSAVFTIWDAGGVDTLDLSGYSSASRIDLREGAFSDAGGMTNNISIAFGALIENAIGGSGNDSIMGNGLANSLRGGGGGDVLFGGGGNDQFLGTLAQLAGDRIVDFSAGDLLLVEDATLAGFEFSLLGETLRLAGGVIVTLAGFAGQLVASAGLGGGVALTAGARRGQLSNDFNGDGRSDVVWREAGGAFSNWLGRADGGLTSNDSAAFLAGVPVAWRVVGSGDFNGDGRSDILWRHDDGRLSNWLGRSDGGFTNNDAIAFANVSVSWRVAAVDDFNGDGRADILWRNQDGRVSDWLGRADGGFATNDAIALSAVSADWRVAGSGDLNGDGRADIVWRHEDGRITNWLGRTDGGFTNNDAVALAAVPASWKVVGTGDFNGDGRSDILWRNDNGALSNWLGRADGGHTNNDAVAFASVVTSWHVADTGDYNGDGRSDILWRNDNGGLTTWLGRSDGSFSNNDDIALVSVATNWVVQNDYVIV